ncbi:MAG: DDE-type integrase/transposase/recombinase [Pseudomonadota bacterium]
MWHTDELHIPTSGKSQPLWRAFDRDEDKKGIRWIVFPTHGQMVASPLTARRDGKAANASLSKAIERVRLHRPVKICTDTAQACRRVIRQITHRYDPHLGSIRRVGQKDRNTLIESDHATIRRLLGHRRSFRSVPTAKATLSGFKRIPTVKRGHIHQKQSGVQGEVALIASLFAVVA